MMKKITPSLAGSITTDLLNEKNSTHFGYCKRGDMEGIIVTTDQLIDFKDLIIASSYFDAYIPLPHMTVGEQKKNIDASKGEGDLRSSVYFETEKGVHGWCDRKTGQVLQWG